MEMLAYMFLPELILLLLTMLIRTVPAAEMLPLFAAAILLKFLYIWRDPDQAMENRQLPAAFMLIELGLITALYAGYGEGGRLWLTVLLPPVTMLLTYAVFSLLRKHPLHVPAAAVYTVLTVLAVAGCVVFRKYADEQNGTCNWLAVGSFTLQYSELIKLCSAAAFAAAAAEYRRNRYTVLLFYGYQMLCVFLLGELGEFGTAMQYIFATCLLGMIVLDFPDHRVPLREHLTAGTLPLAMLAFCSMGLRCLRRLLLCAEQRGADMGRTLLGHSLDFWNQRLNCSGEEIQQAHAWMKETPVVCKNVTGFQSFKDMHPSVLTDYTFTLMIRNFGWLLPLGAELMFAVLMVRVICCHRRAAAAGCVPSAMGVCTAVMFLTQAAIHILGPFGLLPYTGITLPFTSGGFNSLFVCSVLLVTTEILPKRKQNAVPPEPCTDRELHASPGSLPEMLPTRRF